jgi:polyisoprenoid-binding protein YceI
MPRAALTLAAVALLASSPAGAQESYVVDHERSYLVAVIGSSGILAALGSPHAVIATAGSARICLTHGDLSSSSVRFSVPTQSLQIDTPQALRIAKLAPPRADRRDLQEKMLSQRFLWADRHPRMSFETTRVRQVDADTLWLEGHFTMRGITRHVAFPMRVQPNGESVHLSGEVTVKQSDFGMETDSIAGFVRVADAVGVRFLILARGQGSDC